MSSSKNIVILGASFAGLPMAHYLIKNLPEDYSVTLVNPSTHLYWNVASPRAVVEPKLFGKSRDKLFLPFLPAFEKYAAGRFTFVQGKAVSSSPATNTVTVRTCSDDEKSGDPRDVTIQYAHLVIATGSRESAGAWGFKSTQKGTHVDTLAALATSRDALAAATSIVVSGAGATGVELVGEIASHYAGQGKHITLLSSGAQPLPMVREDVGKAARYHLEQMGVEIRSNAKVTRETKSAGGVDLLLSTGETLTAALHISSWGLSPNTEFLPKELLDANGWVTTDQYLKTPAYGNVWALGDVTHWGNRKITTIDAMHAIVAANLPAVVGGKPEAELKAYKHKDDLLLIVPMGNKFGRATGLVFGMRVWGWLGWLLKGRSYMIDGSSAIAAGLKTSGGAKI